MSECQVGFWVYRSTLPVIFGTFSRRLLGLSDTRERLLVPSGIFNYTNRRFRSMFSAIFSDPADYVFSASISGSPIYSDLGLTPDGKYLQPKIGRHNRLLGLTCIFSSGSELLLKPDLTTDMLEMKSCAIPYATTGQKEEVVRLLPEKGADSNYGLVHESYRTGYESGLLIHLALMNGPPSIVRLLLEVGANSDARNESNDSPLGLTMVGDSEEIVKVLVEHSGRSEYDDDYFVSAPRVLKAAPHAKESRTLTRSDELPNHRLGEGYLRWTLWKAVKNGNFDPGRALVNKGANARATYRDRCVISLAFIHSQLPQGRKGPLLEHGAEPDDREEPVDQWPCFDD
jgi:hypothetical protein